VQFRTRHGNRNLKNLSRTTPPGGGVPRARFFRFLRLPCACCGPAARAGGRPVFVLSFVFCGFACSLLLLKPFVKSDKACCFSSRSHEVLPAALYSLRGDRPRSYHIFRLSLFALLASFYLCPFISTSFLYSSSLPSRTFSSLPYLLFSISTGRPFFFSASYQPRFLIFRCPLENGLVLASTGIMVAFLALTPYYPSWQVRQKISMAAVSSRSLSVDVVRCCELPSGSEVAERASTEGEKKKRKLPSFRQPIRISAMVVFLSICPKSSFLCL